jgi:hypothetical protein
MLRGMISLMSSELDLLGSLLKDSQLDHSLLLQKLRTDHEHETLHNLELSEEEVEILLDLFVPEATGARVAVATREKLQAFLLKMRKVLSH